MLNLLELHGYRRLLGDYTVDVQCVQSADDYVEYPVPDGLCVLTGMKVLQFDAALDQVTPQLIQCSGERERSVKSDARYREVPCPGRTEIEVPSLIEEDVEALPTPSTRHGRHPHRNRYRTFHPNKRLCVEACRDSRMLSH